MYIIENLHDITIDHQSHIVALGNFDAVHYGHQEIIKACINLAQEFNKIPAILTFQPHPQAILYPEKNHKLIISNRDKLKYIADLGIRKAFVLPFTLDFSRLNAIDFIENILVGILKVFYVVTGYNFHFAHNRQGNSRMLANIAPKYDFHYSQINQIYYNYQVISSSNIKSLLQLGAINTVNSMLGRTYTITGKVIEGQYQTNIVEFPTVNIALDQNIIYPMRGVYLANIIVDNIKLYGIANIGIRNTIESSSMELLEIHIFNFSDKIYNKTIYVGLLFFIRPEYIFSDTNCLKEQIKLDILAANYMLRNNII